jgi:hypothetical protein
MKNIRNMVSRVQTWLMTATILLGGSGVAAFVDAVNWPVAGSYLAQVECAMLDRKASTRVAAILTDDSAGGDLRLDDAIAQLRLARSHCRAGHDEVARADYEALDRLSPSEPAVVLQGD